MPELNSSTYKTLDTKDLAGVIGGAKYYGNGVYCNKTKCWVEWGTAGSCIGQIVIGGWLGGAIPGKC